MANKLEHANAARHMMVAAKSVLPARLPDPTIASHAEVTTAALQETFAHWAAELANRAAIGQITTKELQTAATVAKASAALSAEQREQAASMSLALKSDEDVVRLVVDSVLALPRERAVAILGAVLAFIRQFDASYFAGDNTGNPEEE